LDGPLPGGYGSNSGYLTCSADSIGAGIYARGSDGEFDIALPPAQLTLSTNPASVPGGTSSTGTITFDEPATATTTVTLASSSTAAVVPATVVVPAGSSSVTPATGLTVRLNPTTVKGGASSSGTITLNSLAGPSGVNVAVTSGTTSVATVTPATVTIAANEASGSFTVNTVNPPTTTTVTITGTGPSYSGSAPLVVDQNAALQMAFSSGTVVGGNAAQLTLTLAKAATTAQTYTLSASNSALSPRASVTIPAGKTSIIIGIPANAVLSNTPSTLSASQSGTVLSTASITVDAPVVNYVLTGSSTVTAGMTVYVTVQLDGPAPSGFSLAASSSNAAITVPSSVSFTAGHAVAEIPLTINAVTSRTTVTITVGGKTCSIAVLP